MNGDVEIFGRCNILGPSVDEKDAVADYLKEEKCISKPTIVVNSNERLVKNTQLYREPHGISKTVTYPINDSIAFCQPSSSRNTDNWDDCEPVYYEGRGKLTRLNLRIGQKLLTFRVTDVAPETPTFEEQAADWDASVMEMNSRRCFPCSRIFASSEELRRHTTVAHSITHFPCSICNRSMSTKNDLIRHMKTHFGSERPYECKLCQKRFRHLSNLTQHHRLHATGKRHFCNVCGRCFKSPDLLAQHHTRCVASGGRPRATEKGKPHRFECTFCPKQFHFKRDQYIHERVHTGERPYECGYCSRKFTQSQALTSHIRLHTGERPYPCLSCERSFKDSSALRKHEALHVIEQQATESEDASDAIMEDYDAPKLTRMSLLNEDLEEEMEEEEDDEETMEEVEEEEILPGADEYGMCGVEKSEYCEDESESLHHLPHHHSFYHRGMR